MKNLIEAKQLAAQTGYKSEITRTTCTVWFHEGNGYNFKAKQCKKYLYLTRYHTNGADNQDIETKKFTGTTFPTCWEDARELFSLYERPQQTTTFTIYRGTQYEKVRITAHAGHDYWQQCRAKLEKKFGELESFSAASRTARLPENY